MDILVIISRELNLLLHQRRLILGKKDLIVDGLVLHETVALLSHLSLNVLHGWRLVFGVWKLSVLCLREYQRLCIRLAWVIYKHGLLSKDLSKHLLLLSFSWNWTCWIDHVSQAIAEVIIKVEELFTGRLLLKLTVIGCLGYTLLLCTWIHTLLVCVNILRLRCSCFLGRCYLRVSSIFLLRLLVAFYILNLPLHNLSSLLQPASLVKGFFLNLLDSKTLNRESILRLVACQAHLLNLLHINRLLAQKILCLLRPLPSYLIAEVLWATLRIRTFLALQVW